MSDQLVSAAGISFLSGGGESGARMREIDWSATPLGEPRSWPQELQTLVAVMLGSGQPMFIAWGRERTMLYNDGYAAMLGLKHPDALGQPFERVWSDILDDVLPIMDAAFAGRETHMDDIMFLMQDRHNVLEETHFAFSYTPVRLGEGPVEGVFCACVETTETVFAFRQLRLLDAITLNTRTAPDSQTVMEATTRLLGEHLKASRCAYADVFQDRSRFTIRRDWSRDESSSVGEYPLDSLGRASAAALRRGSTLVINDVALEQLDEAAKGVFASMNIGSLVCCPLIVNGELSALMTVQDSGPRVWRLDEVQLIEEVVERSWAHIQKIRSEEKLRIQDARKDEFLATLAHELRNPLAPLRTGLEVLELAQSDPIRSREVRAMMGRQLQIMVRLIDDLLDLSRIGRGLIELREQRIDLRDVASAAVETSRPLIQSRQHALSVSLPDEPVWVDADQTRLSQVISNLLNNAARYTKPGGRISLTVEIPGDQATVCVTDNGIGIAEDKLNEIFEMFQQVRDDSRTGEAGLGIGLTLARRLMELHRGTIVAESPGVGLGSRFTVCLPVVLEHADQADVEKKFKPVFAGTAPQALRVLVVDDSQDTVLLLSMMISMRGHEVAKGHSGDQAIELFRTFRPDVVFLDIGLPSIDGYEVARAVRQIDGGDRVHLVALTGWGSDEDKLRAYEAGFDQHLTKPVEGGSIAAILDEAAARTRRVR